MGRQVTDQERARTFITEFFESNPGASQHQGPGARPFHLDWARELVEQARALGAAPFVKQLGAVPCISLERLRTHDAFEHTMQQDPRPTKTPDGTVRAWLSDPAGGDMAEWPSDLRVREFPVVTR